MAEKLLNYDTGSKPLQWSPTGCLAAKSVLILIGMMLLLLATSCARVSSDDNGENSDAIQDSDSASGTDKIKIGAVSLSSVNGNTVIHTNSTLKIKVEFITASGQPLSGKAKVNFELDDPTRGKIISPLDISNGSATVDFTSKDREGIVKIVASIAGGEAKGSLDIQISDVTPPAQVHISADPNRISIKGTSHIKVIVLDSNGQPVVDGTQVNFIVSNESYGTITASALTVKGGASATFTASDISGGAQIIALSGSASQDIKLTIASAELGSIEFVSAVPNIIGLKGSGQIETSTVTFLIKNSNGDPIQEAQSVKIKLFGPGGGEYVEKEGQDEITVSTTNGQARVDVHSGVIPGPVTLKATVATAGGSELSTSSGVISIGGGKPIESHFSLSASCLNVEGLGYDGIESQINVMLADRYGNVEVLEGTTISLYSEAGGINRSVALDKKGQGAVTFRTQRPIPQKTLPTASEVEFLEGLHDCFADIPLEITDPNSPNPRDGLCTIVAVVDGEEEYTDNNANGKYDLGELFDDTYDDIFIDKDDDNSFDPRFEDLVIDQNNNSLFDGYNGHWDGNKKIYKTIDLLVTGEPFIHTDFYKQMGSDPNFMVTSDNPLSFQVFIGDKNYNIPIAGTSYSIKIETGKEEEEEAKSPLILSGTESFTFADTSSPSGGITFSYLLNVQTPNVQPQIAKLVISVIWKGQQKSLTLAVPIGPVSLAPAPQSGPATVDITEIGSIEFVSAVPYVIGLKGSGQVEVSTATFLVKSRQGDPIPDANSVVIELFGPGGGEYLEEGGDKVTVNTKANLIAQAGLAKVKVHSGLIPGPVTLKATVTLAGGDELSTYSGIISIGGGRPTESHFSLSASRLNIEGLASDGIESEITARLADRYGNVEILEGITLSFYSESGGIIRSVALDNTGKGAVMFRTQSPIPHMTSPPPLSEEVKLMTRLNSLFDIPINFTDPEKPNPRDGLCTIVVVVDGEEEFTDSNANGKYDLGESFDDTYDDIFIDKDDDNSFDPLFEDLVIDRNGNSAFDGLPLLPSWDQNKKICKTINLLITGEPFIYTDFDKRLQEEKTADPSFIIEGGSGKSLSFHVFIGDTNYNPPIAGTEYTISTDVGKLGGPKKYTFGDTKSTSGGPFFSYELCDDKAGDLDLPKVGEVIISLTWKGLEKSLTCRAIVD